MSSMKTIIVRTVLLTSLLALAECAIRDLDVTSLDTTSTEPITVSSPVKAHLTDGSTVVFEAGVTVGNGKVSGDGRKYDVTLDTSVSISSITLDEVAAMESYQTPSVAIETQTPPTTPSVFSWDPSKTRPPVISRTWWHPTYHGQKPERAPGPTMLGKTLVLGIIVPPTCGILGWKGKDHNTSLQRFKPLEVFCGIIIGKELPTMLSKDGKETFLVGSINLCIIDLETGHHIHGNIGHGFQTLLVGIMVLW